VPRHARRCRARAGGRCACMPSYQAQVWSPRDQKTIRKPSQPLRRRRRGGRRARSHLRRGTLRALSPATLTEAAEERLEAAQVAVVRTRSGDRYKPSALRSYRQVLQAYVLQAARPAEAERDQQPHTPGSGRPAPSPRPSARSSSTALRGRQPWPSGWRACPGGRRSWRRAGHPRCTCWLRSSWDSAHCHGTQRVCRGLPGPAGVRDAPRVAAITLVWGRSAPATPAPRRLCCRGSR
jgi:hypothetical protein